MVRRVLVHAVHRLESLFRRRIEQLLEFGSLDLYDSFELTRKLVEKLQLEGAFDVANGYLEFN